MIIHCYEFSTINVVRTGKDAEEVARLLLPLPWRLPEVLDERLRVLPVPARVLDARYDLGVALQEPFEERQADGDTRDGGDVVEIDAEPAIVRVWSI